MTHKPETCTKQVYFVGCFLFAFALTRIHDRVLIVARLEKGYGLGVYGLVFFAPRTTLAMLFYHFRTTEINYGLGTTVNNEVLRLQTISHVPRETYGILNGVLIVDC